MKKIILSAVAVFAFGATNAQEAKFGVKAGVDLASAKSSTDFLGTTISATATETGFYLGGFVDVAVSEKFHVQPELMYVSVKDLDFIKIPVLAKFQVGTGFNLLAGPNLGFFTKKATGRKSMNYGIDLGASYDINENFIIDARYDIGLANLIDGATGGDSLKLSGVFIGVGYKF